MTDYALSALIYRHLNNGRMINKYQINNAGENVINEFFTEIMDNLEDYQKQYRMSGHKLVMAPNNNPSYIYLVEKNSSESSKTSIAMKAMTLLHLIGYYITQNKLTYTKLTDSTRGGITEDDLERMLEMEYVKEILQKAGIHSKKEGYLLDEIKNTLVNRCIMQECPGRIAYVLTDAGENFFRDIQNKYNASKSSNEESGEMLEAKLQA